MADVLSERVPVISADPFSLENLAEPHALHEQVREAGPVVYLDSYGIWGMGRYEQVNAALGFERAFNQQFIASQEFGAGFRKDTRVGSH